MSPEMWSGMNEYMRALRNSCARKQKDLVLSFNGRDGATVFLLQLKRLGKLGMCFSFREAGVC
jgi:hypothetical protein